MLTSRWTSKNLEFSKFTKSEAALAKSIYDSNSGLESYDPHFEIFPESEFITHIENDCSETERDGEPKFFLRCIRRRTDSKPIGYFQFEIDAPSRSQCWLPMFVLMPASQGQGVGIEAVESLVSEVRKIFDIQSIGLNVYAENKRALRFWFHCGWNEIMAIDIEESNNREYTCVTLIRRFA